MSGQIRNIAQSAQNRSVIKQAPDFIVYIDGQDYLINRFLGSEGIVVPFNNFTNSWQSSYDLETMVPSGVLTIGVPVQLAHLFRMPGGNKLLKTMSEIRVFAKGYYFSSQGNSVYHQIFKGYISSINYVPNGTTLTITLNCFGSLGMLEKMQTDMSPPLMSSVPVTSVPFTSSTYGLDAYQQIAWVFLYASMVDAFEVVSLQQAAMTARGSGPTGNPYFAAIDAGYVAKWQAYLYDLARDVHVFGSPSVKDVLSFIRDNLKPVDESQTPWNKEAMASFADLVSKIQESKQIESQKGYYSQLRGYMPEMGFSSIQLFNGRLTSRLERLRYLTNLVGFEAYQDVDGAVVIKPPLYNLDVLNLDNSGADANIDPSLSWITGSTNPFVAQYDEILHEGETEDEAGVRLTRIIVQGSATKKMQGPNMQQYLAVAEDIDLPKLQQFGLRTEPIRSCAWLEDGDGAAIYAFAASELARANRGFRNLTFTIPLRPELKLGFPMYFPHLDVYGYIKSIGMSITKGSDATTSVTVDTMRRRPMFPETQNAPTPNTESSTSSSTQFLTPQANLVLQWSQPPTVQKQTNPAQLTDTACSLPIPSPGSAAQTRPIITDQDLQMEATMRQAGLYYGANPDDTGHAWYIQPDQTHSFDRDRVTDAQYCDDLRTVRPYTDQHGYELVGPFPWGRWKSLKDSLTTFTISNALFGNSNIPDLVPSLTPVSAATTKLSNSDAFLFAGDSRAAVTEPAAQVAATLATQKALIHNNKVFELAYSLDPTNQPGPGATLSPNAALDQALADSDAEVNNSVQTMLSGQETSEPFPVSILATVPVLTNSQSGS